MSSDNHRKSFTPEQVQSFFAKAMVVCRQAITAKVSHQNWCKVSQQKPWSCVVRQSPQTFHTRTGAEFHRKSHGRMWSDNHRKSFTPELVQSFTEKAMVVCGQTITAKFLHQSWCKVSEQKPWSCVVRQSPQKFHTRTGAEFHRKSHGRICGQTITAKVSHQNWCKVSQKKRWSCVVRQSPQKFHTRTGAEFHSKSDAWSYVVRQSPQKFHTRTGTKFHSKSHGRVSSDNHRKSFTPELVQSFTAKAMVVCGQTITAKVSHQNWCKVSHKKPWSCVVRQSPQKFHTRTGAKFHSKSHGRVSSDNHRKSFTPELVQSFTEEAMVVCRQTITAKVSHQNWCKVSQQKPWSYVVRQSPQKFHTRTGAKFHTKSHGRVSSDNHRKSFTPELVQSLTAKAMVVCRQTITAKLVQSFTEEAMVVCRQTITAKVSHQNWCKVSQQKPWLYVVIQSPQKFHTRTGAEFPSNVRTHVLRQSLSWSALVVCHSEQMLATNLFSEKSTLRACPLADKFRILLQLTCQLKTDCIENLYFAVGQNQRSFSQPYSEKKKYSSTTDY